MEEKKKCSCVLPDWVQITCLIVTTFTFIIVSSVALAETINFIINVNRAVEKINKE